MNKKLIIGGIVTAVAVAIGIGGYMWWKKKQAAKAAAPAAPAAK